MMTDSIDHRPFSPTTRMSNDHNLRRLETADLEIGATETLQRHITRFVVEPPPVTQRKIDFEHRRPRWLRECMAEATGVFFYVFPGIAAVASFLLNARTPIGAAAFGSFFQIGWGFSLGIAFAIITCAPTSGGHFNPAITICFAVWQGFPWRKVPYYIFSQIFGAFIAGLLLMGMYWPQIQAYKAESIAAGVPLNSATGPGGILCAFPGATQTSLGYLFFIEFFVDSFIVSEHGLPAFPSFLHLRPSTFAASVPREFLGAMVLKFHVLGLVTSRLLFTVWSVAWSYPSQPSWHNDHVSWRFVLSVIIETLQRSTSDVIHTFPSTILLPMLISSSYRAS